MDQNSFKNLWNGLREAVMTLSEAQYWTERRDACEELFKAARQIVYRLRIAANDKDPDIHHWGVHACEQLQKDLASDPASMKALLGDLLDMPAPSPGSEKPMVETTPDESASAMQTEPTTPDILIAWLRDFANQMHGTFQERPKGASITLPVNGDRKQTIIIDLSHSDSKGQPVALFYSVCGEAQPETLRWALETNCNITRGAFGIIRSKERDVLIMLLRRPLAELALERLGSKLRYLANKADAAESRLKTKDIF